MNVKSSTDVDDRSTRMEWNLEENSPVEVISYADGTESQNLKWEGERMKMITREINCEKFSRRI